MVGSAVSFAKPDLILNIRRDSSPPEATLFNSLNSLPLLAENRKLTLSRPLAVKAGSSVCSIFNWAFGIDREARRLANSFSILGIAFFLFAVIFFVAVVNASW